jgi:hypothetical protein
MPAAALIADPPRDADVQAQIQIGKGLARAGGEAMRDTSDQAVTIVPQQGEEVFVRVALMQEDRLPQACGELQVPAKGVELRGSRREIAEVVEAAFADRRHLGRLRECRELLSLRFIEIRRVMRMHSGCSAEAFRFLSRERDGRTRAVDRATGHDHARHPDRRSSLEHFVAIEVVAVVCQIDADVDESWRRRGA